MLGLAQLRRLWQVSKDVAQALKKLFHTSSRSRPETQLQNSCGKAQKLQYQATTLQLLLGMAALMAAKGAITPCCLHWRTA